MVMGLSVAPQLAVPKTDQAHENGRDKKDGYEVERHGENVTEGSQK